MTLTGFNNQTVTFNVNPGGYEYFGGDYLLPNLYLQGDYTFTVGGLQYTDYIEVQGYWLPDQSGQVGDSTIQVTYLDVSVWNPALAVPNFDLYGYSLYPPGADVSGTLGTNMSWGSGASGSTLQLFA
jgi:hypothetical protein